MVPAEAGGTVPLPSAYEVFPDRPLRPSQLGSILLQLAETDNHDKVAAYIQTKMENQTPVAPLSNGKVEEYLEQIEALEQTQKDELQSLFVARAKAVKSKWTDQTWHQNLYGNFLAAGN